MIRDSAPWPTEGAARGAHGKVTLRLSWAYLVAFLALTILCGTSHEFAHHFEGAAFCGCFGTKTFNSFDLCPSCGGNMTAFIAATWAGTIFTYALMWFGVYGLRQPDPGLRPLGFGAVFANFTIHRM